MSVCAERTDNVSAHLAIKKKQQNYVTTKNKRTRNNKRLENFFSSTFLFVI